MKKGVEETKKFVTETGDVTVSENVIASIVKNVVVEIEGVHKISGDEPTGNKFLDLISNSSVVREKGIHVDFKGKDEVTIEISVVLKYGTNVIDIAKNIQEKAKEIVESMVGLKVIDVDVYVDQIAAQ